MLTKYSKTNSLLMRCLLCGNSTSCRPTLS